MLYCYYTGVLLERFHLKFIRWLSIIAWILAALLPGCRSDIEGPEAGPSPSTSQAADPADLKIIVFMVDGVRYTETFGDPVHEHIPEMWAQLRPLGTVVPNFRNRVLTTTIPGHTSTLTGTWQTLANDGTERPTQPTIFEYFRLATGAPERDVVLVGGKTKLDAFSYSLHPDYGAALGARTRLGPGRHDGV